MANVFVLWIPRTAHCRVRSVKAGLSYFPSAEYKQKPQGTVWSAALNAREGISAIGHIYHTTHFLGTMNGLKQIRFRYAVSGSRMDPVWLISRRDTWSTWVLAVLIAEQRLSQTRYTAVK